MQHRIAVGLAAGVLAAGALAASTLLAPPARAATPISIQSTFDGGPLAMNVAPRPEAGRTLAPMGTVLEALGSVVSWDVATGRMTGGRGGIERVMQVGSPGAALGAEAAGIYGPPAKLSGLVQVPAPVPVASQTAGAQVSHDAATATADTGSRGRDRGVSRGEARPLGDQVAAMAGRFEGYPYAWGGTTPDGFDCSGFTQYIYGHFGISLPRNSYDQFQGGIAVSRANLRPGDLVFFTTYAAGASHVGIYLGGGRFVNAESTRTGVTVRSLDNPYWSSHYLGARRYR